MKVVKPGKKFVEKDVTCSNRFCGAVLRVEESDVKLSYVEGDIREPSSESYYASCCECGNNLPLLKDEIPARLRKKLMEAAGHRIY